MNIGRAIKELRKTNKLTQSQLAKKIGKSEITIRKYESNDTNPPLDVINRIAETFDIKVWKLIKRSEEN